MQRDSENPLPITAGDCKVSDVETAETPAGGRRVLVHLELRHPISDYTGLEITVVYELNPSDFYTRQWIELKSIGKGTFFLDAVWPHVNRWSPGGFRLGGLGQPLLADDLFLGLEYPSSLNTDGDGQVRLGSRVGLNIPAEGFRSEAAVLGVADRGNAHPAFMHYVQCIRRTSPRPFILYNTWYDLQGVEMTSGKALERIPILQKNLLEKYSLELDSFLLHDGWDDPQNLWRIDTQRFPNGFRELVAALAKSGSKLGIWFGPLGGYGGGPATNRSVRITTGRGMGMEVNSAGEYFCLAGKNYGAYLRDSMLRMIRDYGVNYFKIDGILFACNELDHGHPVGVYAREAYVRSVINLATSLEAANPRALVGLATGPWLSPWWLRYADFVDYGGEDFAYLDAVPSLTPRQSAISYNDSVGYRNYALKGVQFPMSSLDGEGIIKGRHNLLGGENESLEDWQDAVISFVGSGQMRADLYLTPTLLKPQEWEPLGKGLQYLEANARPLLDNGTWVLGDPGKGEPYGVVHTSTAKTIVALRNPGLQPAWVDLPLTPENGFTLSGQPLEAEVVFPFREVLLGEFHIGDILPAELDGYEQRVMEIRPLAAQDTRVRRVRFSLVSSGREAARLKVLGEPGTTQLLRVPNEKAIESLELEGRRLVAHTQGDAATFLVPFEGQASGQGQPVFSQPIIQVRGSEGQSKKAWISFWVQIPMGFEDATLGVLIQSTKPLGEVKTEWRVNAKPASLAARKSDQGLWYWYGTQLGVGRQQSDLTLQIPAGPTAPPRVSGWLRVRRKLAGRELVLKFKPRQSTDNMTSDPLPVASDNDRKTYRLFVQGLE